MHCDCSSVIKKKYCDLQNKEVIGLEKADSDKQDKLVRDLHQKISDLQEHLDDIYAELDENDRDRSTL